MTGSLRDRIVVGDERLVVAAGLSVVLVGALSMVPGLLVRSWVLVFVGGIYVLMMLPFVMRLVAIVNRNDVLRLVPWTRIELMEVDQFESLVDSRGAAIGVGARMASEGEVVRVVVSPSPWWIDRDRHGDRVMSAVDELNGRLRALR